MKRFWILSIILVLALAACGGDDSDSGSGLEGANDNDTGQQDDADDSSANDDEGTDSDDSASDSVVSSIPPVEDNIFEMPAVDGLEGRLLFVRGNASNQPNDGDGNRLFMAEFDGSAPTRLATRVAGPSVSVSPDYQYVIFSGVEGRVDTKLYAIDLNSETLEPMLLADLEAGFAFVSGWSPNGEWVSVNNANGFGAGEIITRLDGTQSVTLGDGTTLWLDNNNAIFLELESVQGGFGPNFNAVALSLFNTETMELEPLDIDVDFSNFSFGSASFIELLRDNGYNPVPNVKATGAFGGNMYLPQDILLSLSADNGGGSVPNFCDTFRFNTYDFATGESTEWHVYGEENGNPAQFTDFRLEEDVLYYQLYYFENCRGLPDNIRVDLIRHPLDGEPELLLPEMYAGVDANLSFSLRTFNGSRYAVSPDGQHVAWVQGSLDSLESSIVITDVDTGQSAPVLVSRSSSRDNFIINDSFTSFHWIP